MQPSSISSMAAIERLPRSLREFERPLRLSTYNPTEVGVGFRGERNSAKADPIVDGKSSVLPFFALHVYTFNFMKCKRRENDCAIMFRRYPHAFFVAPAG